MARRRTTQTTTKKRGKKRGGFIGALLIGAAEMIGSAVGGSLLERAIKDIQLSIEARNRPPINLDESELQFYIPPFFKTKSNPEGALWVKGEPEQQEEEQRGTGLRRRRKRIKKH